MENKLRIITLENVKKELNKEKEIRTININANHAINSRLSSYGYIGLGMYIDYVKPNTKVIKR